MHGETVKFDHIPVSLKMLTFKHQN